MKDIDINQLAKYKKEYLKDDKNYILQNALSTSTIEKVISRRRLRALDTKMMFSHEIKTHGITNQKASGRCWMFAGCNLLREQIIKKLELEDFEISQSYLAFYDKIEKFNNDVRLIIDLVEKQYAEKGTFKYTDYELTDHLAQISQDGGNWCMFVNLVNKYGIVPKEVFPESITSSQTRVMNNLLTSLVCQTVYAYITKRKAEGKDVRDDFEGEIEKANKKAFKIIALNYGVPQDKFDYAFEIAIKDDKKDKSKKKDKDDKKDDTLVPKKFEYFKGTQKEFYNKYIGEDFLNQFVRITTYPKDELTFNQLYTDRYSFGMYGKKEKYLNVSYDDMKKLCVDQIKNNELIWFCCDCLQNRDGSEVWDDQSYDYKSAFGVDLYFDKGPAMDLMHIEINHAMLLCGVNIDKKGNVDRWKIENSWGKDAGEKGYYVATESWMEKYIGDAGINIKYLSDEQKAMLDGEPIVIDGHTAAKGV